MDKLSITMGNSFQFIDIIFFAMIAVFLILRLRGVLGKRDGNEESGILDLFKQNVDIDKPDNNKESDVVKLSDGGEKDDTQISGFEELVVDNENEDPLVAGIAQVQKHDTDFNDEDFMVGARVAFETILNAYASASLDELQLLLSNEVYSNFAKAIQDREQAGHFMEDTLIGIMKSEIVEAYMEDLNAHITIKFVSEQVNAIRDENGDVVQGNANEVLTVSDFWTFTRDTKNLDPNWILAATRSLE
jgi:predicted lipid-binding transport protein (Tim44 family)